jgi:NAD(P)-dependent dehydrogenase (short-subunit alcohol dehydrogenase family)
LVATAGIVKHHPIEDLTVEDWQDVIDINLTGVYNCAKAVVSPMKKQKYGRMIFISSLGGRTARHGVGVNYAASKAGVIGLTQALGYELGPWNITVNSIAPGPIQGKMFDTLPAEKIEHLKTGVRIPRLGSPSEVAAAIAYMASEEAGWTTGEILDVNGGLYF